VADPKLADEGDAQIELAEREMGALLSIRERFAREQPFANLRIACNLHVTKETAVLVHTLVAGGALVAITGCNNFSTQDAVAAALARRPGVAVLARHACTVAEYYERIEALVQFRPHVCIDDGGDLNVAVHADPAAMASLLGGSEQTSSGVLRLQAMGREGKLRVPVVLTNECRTKKCIDNYYGCGQSVIDGVIRGSGTFVTGKTFVVVGGGGLVGSGVAFRARGLGARVIVTEVDPFLALRAKYDGHEVMPAARAFPQADIIVTCTGNRDVVTLAHIEACRDGVILANAGQFDTEINVVALRAAAQSCVPLREGKMERFAMPSGKTVFLLGGGQLVNLSCAEGHPSAVMSTSFCGQALAAELIVQRGAELGKGCFNLPADLDDGIAALQLQALGIEIDSLTDEQRAWLKGWEQGTE
jgi:adenosylhomocysteinase